MKARPFNDPHRRDAGVLFKSARFDRTRGSGNLKGLAYVMTPEEDVDDTAGCTVETPHLGVILPNEPRVSLETIQSNDIKSINMNGGADRPEESTGQIAHKSGFEFTRIGHAVDVSTSIHPTRRPRQGLCTPAGTHLRWRRRRSLSMVA